MACVIAAGGAAVAYHDGSLNPAICDGACPGTYIDPPVPLGVMPEPQLPQAAQAARTDIDGDAVMKAARSALGADDLGDRVGFAAAGNSGKPVSTGPKALIPASTTKILTAFAALDRIDHHKRVSTSVVADADELTLVGGGDPFLDTKPAKKPKYAHVATLQKLAKRTADHLKQSNTTSVSLGWDESLFSGPAQSSTWSSDYVGTGVIAPVNALATEHGTTGGPARSADPAATAAGAFAKQLKKQGISVTEKTGSREASGTTIAEVRSATVAQMVTAMLVHSDNDAAEIILRHIAIAADNKPTFKGGLSAVQSSLADHDIPLSGLKLHDGSGLSRDNQIAPVTLVRLLQQASDDSATSAILSSMPIAAFNGTLDDRFTGSNAARGLTHAKSGTLTGVTTLAGTVVDANGSVIYFAVMADDLSVDFEQAKSAEDKVVSALAKCQCS